MLCQNGRDGAEESAITLPYSTTRLVVHLRSPHVLKKGIGFTQRLHHHVVHKKTYRDGQNPTGKYISPQISYSITWQHYNTPERNAH